MSLTPQLFLNDRHTVQLPTVAVAEVHRDTESPVLFVRKMKRTELVPASISALKKRNRVWFLLEKKSKPQTNVFFKSCRIERKDSVSSCNWRWLMRPV